MQTSFEIHFCVDMAHLLRPWHQNFQGSAEYISFSVNQTIFSKHSQFQLSIISKVYGKCWQEKKSGLKKSMDNKRMYCTCQKPSVVDLETENTTVFFHRHLQTNCMTWIHQHEEVSMFLHPFQKFENFPKVLDIWLKQTNLLLEPWKITTVSYKKEITATMVRPFDPMYTKR